VFPPQEGLSHWHTLFHAWIPEEGMKERIRRDHVPFDRWRQDGHLTATAGDCVDYDYIEGEITRQAARYRVQLLGTDQWNSRMLTQRLTQAGVVEVVEIPQTMAGMSEAMKTLERLLRRGEMTHENNPCARWCFGNVRCAVDGNENQKPVKHKSVERIDVAVAWINAVAAAAAALAVGATPAQIQEHLPQFRGAHRRFEVLGQVNGTIADDYAHHPAELKVTLEAAKEMDFNRVWAVFQPFTYSRTALLLEDFAKILPIADRVVLSAIMGAREVNTYGIYAKDLADKIPGCVWFETFPEIARYVIQEAQPGDLVITLGCGDVYKCAHMMLGE
jgi:UDP-N-acetylmuramate-alanine ligase